MSSPMSSVVMNEKSDEELNGCSRDSLEEEENKMEVEEEEDYDEASAGSDSERQEEDDDDEDEEDGGGKNEDDDDVVSPLIEGLSRGKSSSSISEVSDDACYKKGRGKEMSPPSRKRSSRMTRPPSRNGEYEDYDASFDGDVFDDADANGATAAAQEFFTARLAEFLQTHQDEKSPCSLNLWRIQIMTQKRGLSAGYISVYYHRASPPRKFKSRVEVAMDLGIFPYARTNKMMSRSLQHLCAVEARERMLISQQIDAHENPDDIKEFFVDPVTSLIFARPCPTPANPRVYNVHCFPLIPNAKIRSDDERDADKEVRKTDVVTVGPENGTMEAIEKFNHDYCISYGNTSVLNCGRIIPSGHFHNREYLFPLGLKIVRQEHDTLTDRVVDCVCEIDCYQHSDPQSYPLRDKTFDQLDAKTKADLRPLFRVTVAWELGYDKRAIRVYEGKSPQLVWQSVLLERLGTPGKLFGELLSKPVEEDMLSALERIQTDEDLPVLSPKTLEDMDDEERHLRTQLIELRRLHMRALSAGQEKGEVQAVKPRLALSHVDQFFDEGLLPLFEGMPGAEECLGYQYIDSRLKDTNKTATLKNLSVMQTKIRGLDKIFSKFATERVNVLLKIKKDQKREAFELSKQQKIDEKKKKLERNQLMIERRNRAKELEKTARNVRDETSKAVNSRRQQAKFRVELVAKDEEDVPEMNEALSLAMREEEKMFEEKENGGKDKVKTVRGGGEGPAEESDEEDDQKSDESQQEDNKTIPRFSRRPKNEDSALHLPNGYPISLPDSIFGKAMELWQFVVTHADVLGLIAVPTERLFETALAICDPAPSNLQGIVNIAEARVLGGTNASELQDDLYNSPSRVKTHREATDMLNKLAIVLCQPLMTEYNRLMMIESTEPYLGGLGLELNELTWKEVARVVLTSTLCRHAGLSDLEVMSCHRGRGHLTAPDTTDRRVLRLAKRRLWFRYGMHLYRSQSDKSAITSQRGPINHAIYRQHMLASQYVGLGSDFSSGLVLRLCSPSTYVTAILDDRNGQERLYCFQESVRVWCQLFSHLSLFGPDAPFATTWMALEVTHRLLENAVKGGIYNSLHRSALQVLELCRTYRFTNRGESFSRLVYDVLLIVLRRLVETASVGTSEEVNRNVMKVVNDASVNPYRVGATQSYHILSRRRKLYDQPSPSQLFRLQNEAKVTASFSNCFTYSTVETKSSGSVGEDNDEDDVSDENKSSPRTNPENDNAANILSFNEADSDVASLSLSTALQSCYRALKSLILHSHAITFFAPVDGQLVQGYYNFIRNPLFLSDILSHLLSGGYENDLRAFYKDVHLVFQNALAFNEESTAIAQAAVKLQFVFDRLIYECVLKVNSSLKNMDNCHVCASSYKGDEGATVICDRCDGPYHVECLTPPLTSPPRGEWFCPNCVAGRGVELVHPLMGAIVHVPSDSNTNECYGRVVSIVPKIGWCREMEIASVNPLDSTEERLETYLEYHIETGYARDQLSSLTDEDVDVIGRGNNRTTVWLLSDVLLNRYYLSSQHQDASKVNLPDGYTMESYDRLAAIASCHSGWCSYNGSLPPCVDPAYSRNILEVAQGDPTARISTVLKGAAVLSPFSSLHNFQSEDWVSVLLALAYKAASVDNRFNEKGQGTEKDIEAKYMDLVKDLKQERSLPGLDEYEQKPGAVTIGNKLLVKGEEEFGDNFQSDEESCAQSDNGSSDEEDEDSDEEEEDESEAEDLSLNSSVEEEEVDEDDSDEDEEESVEEKEFGESEDEMPVKKRKSESTSDTKHNNDKSHNVATSNRHSNTPKAASDRSEDNDERNGYDDNEESSSSSDASSDESDSDDIWDDDLEQAAQNGVLLSQEQETSEKTSEKEPKKSSLFIWENQRRSRRKGIEDALLSISVVKSVNQKLLDDDVCHDQESDTKASRVLSQLSPGGLLYPVVRQCLPRSANMEDIDIDVWTASFERRMRVVMEQQLKLQEEKDANKKTDDTNIAVKLESSGDAKPSEMSSRRLECEWCGQSEEYACSQLVHGQTWSEWFKWKQHRDERARARQAMLDKQAELELDRILSGEVPPSAQEATSNMTKKDDFTVVQAWLPVDETEAELVLKEAFLGSSTDKQPEQSTNGSEDASRSTDLLIPPPNVEIEVLKGSVIVHECCAETMSVIRMNKYMAKLEACQKAYRQQRRLLGSKAARKNSAQKQRLEAALRLALTRKEGEYPDERILADVLVGLGQGKVVSLGYDFSGNVYYALSGSSLLLVCSKCPAEYSKESDENPLVEDNPPYAMVSMPDPLGLGEESSSVTFNEVANFRFQPKTMQWRVMADMKDICRIIRQLSQDASPERSLRSALEILFLRQVSDESGEESSSGEERTLSEMLRMSDDYKLLTESEPCDGHKSELMCISGEKRGGEELNGNGPAGKRLKTFATEWQTNASSEVSFKKTHFATGTRLLCRGSDCLGNELLWDAEVLSRRKRGSEECLYLVRFTGWGEQYDSWVTAEHLLPASASHRESQLARLRSSHDQDGALPHLLSSLHAHSFLSAPGRHFHSLTPNNPDSSVALSIPRVCLQTPEQRQEDELVKPSTLETVNLSVRDELSTLKSAMLLVQAAMPFGCMDESEDRWGGSGAPVPYFSAIAPSDMSSGGSRGREGPLFFHAWRHCVMSASTPLELMECQIMLEYGVRTAWLRTTGAKLMTCLASRHQSVRAPTFGLVAIRLWSLDKAIRYDKVKQAGCIEEDENEMKKEKANKLKAKQASRKKKLQKEESTKKRAQYRR